MPSSAKESVSLDDVERCIFRFGRACNAARNAKALQATTSHCPVSSVLCGLARTRHSALPDSVCPGSPCGHASSPRAPARARSAKTFRARIRLLEARKLELSRFHFPLACSGNFGVAQDTRFAAGAGRNRREFVMKTSENRSEQDAKIIGMSKADGAGRRKAASARAHRGCLERAPHGRAGGRSVPARVQVHGLQTRRVGSPPDRAYREACPIQEARRRRFRATEHLVVGPWALRHAAGEFFLSRRARTPQAPLASPLRRVLGSVTTFIG